MIDIVVDSLKDSVIDSIKLLPFLFLTYLLMEWLEHKTSSKTKQLVQKSGKAGPFFGALLGAVPQCGFSTAGTNLYAGRVISLGTLFSIYLSTSDEMLPVLLSERAPVDKILLFLAIKIVIGMLVGFIIDFILNKFKKNDTNIEKIGHVCEHDHCHCDKSIFKSSLKHTAIIFCFIFLISLALNIVMGLIGDENLRAVFADRPFLAPVIAGLIGLIPNCAASVCLTEVYLDGIISVGTLMAGLLPNAGVALIVLFRENKGIKKNLSIVALLYLIGVVCGIIIGLMGIQ